MNAVTQVLLYAVVAGLSALALLSILTVLSSGNGRANGSAFALGFLLGQSLTLTAVLVLGLATVPNPDRGNPTVAAVLELLLGAAMLVFAWHGRRPRDPVELTGESRSSALLARLRGIRARTAFAFSFLLGIGGIKRLTLTILAGTTLALSGFTKSEELGLSVLYVLIATVLVWLPASVYLVVGARVDAWNARVQGWVTANQHRAAVLSTFVFGVLLVGLGLISLLT